MNRPADKDIDGWIPGAGVAVAAATRIGWCSDRGSGGGGNSRAMGKAKGAPYASPSMAPAGLVARKGWGGGGNKSAREEQI